MPFVVELTEEALAMLGEISDRRIRGKLFDRIQALATDPGKQGTALVDDLAGYRSVRAVGQRYRIVYEVQGTVVRVLVVAVGLRREGHRTDIYVRLARRVRKD